MKTFTSKLWMTIYLLLAAAHSLLATAIFAQNKVLSDKSSTVLTKETILPYTATLVNINNFSMWIRADGWSGRNPFTGDAGAFFPRGTVGVIFQDGIVWGGYVQDGSTPSLRVGGQTYNIGTQTGRIISPGIAEDPNVPDVRIWRIRRDYLTADLTSEALDVYRALPKPPPPPAPPDTLTKVLLCSPADSAALVQQLIDSLRLAYAHDWSHWPWQKGAPFYDMNENGAMDLGEEPGLVDADQVVWLVANDLNPELTKGLYGSPPIGLEMQVTLWAYSNPELLRNMIFKRVRLIYKGTASTPANAHIDSMFIGQWSDPDLGDAADDFVGCDTLLSLGYVYNSRPQDSEYDVFRRSPPAIGYSLLRGPLVKSQNPEDIAFLDFQMRQGYRHLTMTSFNFFAYSEDPDLGYYNGSYQIYNLLNGYQARPYFPARPVPFPDYLGNPTRFMFNGDPLTQIGDVDGKLLAAGDRRLLMNTGPFAMALGDTQEVIIAMAGAIIGNGHLANIGVMKYFARWARFIALSNFDLSNLPSSEPPPPPTVPAGYYLSPVYPNPFSASGRTQATIRYLLPRESDVELTIYDVLGRQIKTLVNRTQVPGDYTVTWDGTSAAGEKVASGVYFIRLRAWIFEQTRKILVMR